MLSDKSVNAGAQSRLAVAPQPFPVAGQLRR